MAAPTHEMFAELPCHHCGYDLRAQSQDGKCPECGASVAESRRLAAVPHRPAWRDSDPRWRRRILAGLWILVLMPLMDVLQALRWDSDIRVPNVFSFPGTVRTLEETLIGTWGVYPPILFCIGTVLLFSKERGRRRSRLDWTRRWGILCSYVVSLLAAANVLTIAALVLAGIAALFQNMPLRYQPGVTRLFVELGAGYLRYGPQPNELAGLVQVAFSAMVILLACAPLFDALRSSGLKRFSAIVLVPLALFSHVYLAQAAWACRGAATPDILDLYYFAVYFRPQVLVEYLDGSLNYSRVTGSMQAAFFVEAVKWCVIAAIAVWLSIAQAAAWWQRRKSAVSPGV